MKYLGKKHQANFGDDIKVSEFAFITFSIDIEFFEEEVLQKSTKIRNFIQSKEEEYPQIINLACDIFSSLYRYTPKLIQDHKIKSDFKLNYLAIKHLLTTMSYKEVRSFTQTDLVTSVLGTEILLEGTFDAVSDILEKHKELLKAYKEAQKKLKEAYEKRKPIDQEKIEEMLRKYDEEMNNLVSKKVKRDLNKSMNILLDQQKGISEQISQWGLGNDGTYQKMSYEEKVGMLDKLRKSKKLQRISLLAGKLRDIYLAGEKAKSKKNRTRLEDITQGNDLPRVLPAEVMGIGDPILEQIFLKKYGDKSLLQHNYGGTKKKGKGPIVVLIDSSGSMSGDNEIYSKAVALALLEAAKKQKRSMVAVHFTSGEHPKNIYANYFLKKDPYNISEVIKMAEYFGSGGTDFRSALDRARMEITEERDFSKADIIMITDGQSYLTDDWLKDFQDWRKKKNISVFSVLMDRGYGGSTETLKKFSDKVHTLDNVGDAGFDIAKKLFDHLL